MGQFIRITPFMHVEDPARALAFFTDILGFEVPYRQSGYAYVESEGCDIRIPGTSGGWRAPRQPPIRLTSTCATSMCCMQGSSRGSITRGGRRARPADKPCRQRELLVRAPDGNLIAFGRAMVAAAGSS